MLKLAFPVKVNMEMGIFVSVSCLKRCTLDCSIPIGSQGLRVILFSIRTLLDKISVDIFWIRIQLDYLSGKTTRCNCTG